MVGIINYGAGNLRSLSNALTHLGIDWTITSDPKELQTCSHLILPGVGSFRFGMTQLHALGLYDYLKNTDQPILGICLGMQLLAEEGEEGGQTKGLGLLQGKVKKLKEPHVGWDYWGLQTYYFTHHYAIKDAPWAIQQDRLWACQFHPEKSQQNGLNFLQQWYASSQS